MSIGSGAIEPRRILVPLDGRRASEAALATAVGLARQARGSLYLLSVVATAAPTVGAGVRQQAAVQRVERYLAATRRRIATDAPVDVSTAVWSGAPAAAIVKAADLVDADLIVMARSGRPRAARPPVGSVIERVLCGTRRPVLVVTSAAAGVDTSPGDAAPLPEDAAPAPARPWPAPPGAATGRRSPPVAAYLDARRSLQERERDVRRVVTAIQEAARSLQCWHAVHVAPAGAGFPKEVTMMGRAIDASSWPTAPELADVLAAWHSSAEAARVAWERVPRHEREALPPPP